MRRTRDTPRSSSPAFQGYADIVADTQGRYRFVTLVTQMYFEGTDAALLAQDKLLQHDRWGKASLPASIFARLHKERSTLDAGAARYTFDVVL